MQAAIERLNAAVKVKGYSFEIVPSDVGAEFRCGPDDGARKEWYKVEAWANGLLVCHFGEFKSKESLHAYSKADSELSAKDHADLKSQAKRKKRERELKQSVARNIAQDLFARYNLQPSIESDYLENLKKMAHLPPAIAMFGENDRQRVLVIPMFDEKGEIWNFQRISSTGVKRFQTNARTEGLFHEIPGLDDGLIFVGEGYATCLAVALSTGAKAYVAFDCKNLEHVVPILVKRFGSNKVILLADFDGANLKKVGENQGMYQAQRLSLKWKIRVAVPVCREEWTSERKVDFCDLWTEALAGKRERAVLDFLCDGRLADFAELAEFQFKAKKEKKPKVEVVAPVAPVPSETVKPVIPKDALYRVIEDVSHLVKPQVRQSSNYGLVSKDIFPDMDGNRVMGTIDNFQTLMQAIGAVLRYNVIRAEQEWFLPGEEASVDNYRDVIWARILDLCARAGFPDGRIEAYLNYLTDKNQFNPVAAWVESKPWDKKSRLEELYSTLVTKADLESHLEGAEEKERLEYVRMKKTLIRKWLIMAIAGAYSPTGITAPALLVLQGNQYIGKTKWLTSLVPHELGLTVEGVQINPSDKDSVKQVVCYWLVELGELEATFKRADLSALKAFITKGKDTFRPAYARFERSLVRRTVFFGSVNDPAYLADRTGNRRFWTIPVIDVKHNHSIDTQQLWAEVLVEWKAGGDRAQFWLTDEENAWLTEHNREFEILDPIDERLLGRFDWGTHGGYMTATEIGAVIGYDKPTKPELNTIASAVRRLSGGKSSKKTKRGQFLWVGKRIGNDTSGPEF